MTRWFGEKISLAKRFTKRRSKMSVRHAMFRFVGIVGVLAAIGLGCSDSHSPTAPMVATHAAARHSGRPLTSRAPGRAPSTPPTSSIATATPLPRPRSRRLTRQRPGCSTRRNGCGFDVSFQGTIQGNTFTATITGDRFSSGSTATGAVNGPNLDITLVNSFGSSREQMHLHR